MPVTASREPDQPRPNLLLGDQDPQQRGRVSAGRTAKKRVILGLRGGGGESGTEALTGNASNVQPAAGRRDPEGADGASDEEGGVAAPRLDAVAGNSRPAGDQRPALEALRQLHVNVTPFTIRLRVRARVYDALKAWRLPQVMQQWPTASTEVSERDGELILEKVRLFLQQEAVREGEHYVVTEVYAQQASGFPGRLTSTGCQGIKGAIRANILCDTADLDMNNAQARCILWVCRAFGIETPMWRQYCDERDGPHGMLQRLQDEARVSKGRAKQLAIMTLNSQGSIGSGRSTYLRDLDRESKMIQRKLLARPELLWIRKSCKSSNVPGSFMAYLFNLIECRLLLRVRRMLEEEFDLHAAALVFDGLNVHDPAAHGDKRILERAFEVCEEVAADRSGTRTDAMAHAHGVR